MNRLRADEEFKKYGVFIGCFEMLRMGGKGI
jgi:hypothetical protein